MSAVSVCTGTAPTDPQARLNRTCTACRQRKVKCTPPAQEKDTGNANTCARCWKHSLDCVFPPSARKKTRRRNEDKIRDLESRLEAIQAAMKSGPGRQNPPHRGTTPSSSALNETPLKRTFKESLHAPSADPATDGFMSPDLIEKLYRSFISDLEPLYPLVSVPEHYSWQTVRKERPFLFKAMITAASSSAQPGIAARMFRDTAQSVAEKVAVVGEKSVDLIQALLILSTWHLPPSTYSELKFSQYAHMAATMVSELRCSNDERYAIPTACAPLPPSHDLDELCRTFLAAYFLCSSMAMSYRRPTCLPYGPWVEDCIRTLEASPSAHLNDHTLVKWVKLHRIAEESLLAVTMDGMSSFDVSDSRTRFILKNCIEKLNTWRLSSSENRLQPTLEIHYQTMLITLHEPALYAEHDISDFRPPYVLRRLPLSKRNEAYPGTHSAGSYLPCILSAQALIRTFLGLPAETLLFMPVITYTRVAYAVIILTKCFVSMRPYPSITHLRLEDFLDAISQLLGKLEGVMDQSQGRVPLPAVFHSILSAIYMWCVRVFTLDIFQDDEDLMEPMKHLSLGDDKNLGNPKVKTSMPTVGQSFGIARELVPPEHILDGGVDLIGDANIDTSEADSSIMFPDFADFMDHAFV